MKENQILWIGEAALVILILIVASAIAIVNIIRGNVPHPRMFLIVAVGFLFLAVAKASVSNERLNKGELAALYWFVFLFIASRGGVRWKLDKAN